MGQGVFLLSSAVAESPCAYAGRHVEEVHIALFIFFFRGILPSQQKKLCKLLAEGKTDTSGILVKGEFCLDNVLASDVSDIYSSK
jgi:hypothetical protein